MIINAIFKRNFGEEIDKFEEINSKQNIKKRYLDEDLPLNPEDPSKIIFFYLCRNFSYLS
jgi:hypothetical protein